MRKLNFKPMFWLIGIIVLSMVIGILSCEEDSSPSTDGNTGGGKTLLFIEITPPTKTQYNVGDSLTKADLVSSGFMVMATYSNGTKANVTSSPLCTVDAGTAMQTTGTKTIKVSYFEGAFSDEQSFTINVGSGTLPGIAAIIANPAIGHSASAPFTVTLTCSTPGVTIWYTTDETNPENSPSRIQYNSSTPINITATINFKAVAMLSGYNNNSLDGKYTITNTSNKVLNGLSVVSSKNSYNVGDTIDKSTLTVTATYTDGTSAPVTNYTTSAVGEEVNPAKIIQVTYIENDKTEFASFTIVVTAAVGGKTQTPGANVASGSVVESGSTVTLSSEAGAQVYYTTTSGTPDTLASGPITISANVTIRAIAKLAGKSDSDIATFTYTIRAATTTFKVEAFPVEGDYEADSSKQISLSTMAGAKIYYTTDGSVQEISEFMEYTGAFTITPAISGKGESILVKAVAKDSNNQFSDVFQFQYWIGPKGSQKNPPGNWITLWYEVPATWKKTGAGGWELNWVRVVCSGFLTSNPNGWTAVEIKEIYWSDTMTTTDPNIGTGSEFKTFYKVDFTEPDYILANRGWGLDGKELPSFIEDGLLKVKPFIGWTNNSHILGSICLSGLTWDKKAGYDPYIHSSTDQNNPYKPRPSADQVTSTYWAKYIGITVREEALKDPTGNMAWDIPDDAGFLFGYGSDMHEVHFNQFSKSGTITSW